MEGCGACLPACAAGDHCPSLQRPTLSPFCLPAPALQTSNQRKELDELRDMKADVERREKAQAEVISQQVRRCRACKGAVEAGRGAA